MEHFNSLPVTLTSKKNEWRIDDGEHYCSFSLNVRNHAFGIRSGMLYFYGDEVLIAEYISVFIHYYQSFCEKESIDVFEVSTHHSKDGLDHLPSLLSTMGFQAWSEFHYEGHKLKNTLSSFRRSNERLKIVCWERIEKVMKQRIAFERVFSEMKERDKTFTFKHTYYENLWVCTKFYLRGVDAEIRLTIDRDTQETYLLDIDTTPILVTSAEDTYTQTSSLLKILENKLRIRTLYNQPRHHFYGFLKRYVSSNTVFIKKIDEHFLKNFSMLQLEEMTVELEKPKEYTFKTAHGSVRRVAFLDHICVLGLKEVHLFSKSQAEEATATFEHELIKALRNTIIVQEEIV